MTARYKARARRRCALPEVSVVVAAHNQADFLGETIESVLAQTFADWELVVVDDGSTDTTAAVAGRFAARDPRVRCLAGPARARRRPEPRPRGDERAARRLPRRRRPLAPGEARAPGGGAPSRSGGRPLLHACALRRRGRPPAAHPEAAADHRRRRLPDPRAWQRDHPCLGPRTPRLSRARGRLRRRAPGLRLRGLGPLAPRRAPLAGGRGGRGADPLPAARRQHGRGGRSWRARSRSSTRPSPSQAPPSAWGARAQRCARSTTGTTCRAPAGPPGSPSYATRCVRRRRRWRAAPRPRRSWHWSRRPCLDHADAAGRLEKSQAPSASSAGEAASPGRGGERTADAAVDRDAVAGEGGAGRG